MPIPLVLATIVLIWWLGLRLRGPGAACLAALIFAVASTDPYLYGNGANLEHAINLFSVAALALTVFAWDREGRWPIVAAGACLGAACLVKQVAIAHLLVFAIALLLRRKIAIPEGLTGGPSTRDVDRVALVARPPVRDRGGQGTGGRATSATRGSPTVAAGSGDPPGGFGYRKPSARVADVLALLGGFAAVLGVAAGVLTAQGAGREAFEDVVIYGSTMAAETPADPNAPPGWVRWITGNADPSGRLPWPFGRTNYLVWWGTGTWPLWLAGVPALAWLVFGPASTAPSTTGRRVDPLGLGPGGAPGSLLAHYYLLPVPGIALAVAVFLADVLAMTLAASRRIDLFRALLGASCSLAVVAALVETARVQVRDYLMVPAEELTSRYKGGGQWIANRALGRELARRAEVWESPELAIWGWQSPIYAYSGLDNVTRHFFVDPLMKAYAGGSISGGQSPGRGVNPASDQAHPPRLPRAASRAHLRGRPPLPRPPCLPQERLSPLSARHERPRWPRALGRAGKVRRIRVLRASTSPRPVSRRGSTHPTQYQLANWIVSSPRKRAETKTMARSTSRFSPSRASARKAGKATASTLIIDLTLPLASGIRTMSSE